MITRHKDRFAFIIGTIYSHFLSDRDDSQDGASLNSRVLMIAIGNRYKRYLDFLEQNGYILRTIGFRVGNSSNRYAIIFPSQQRPVSNHYTLQDSEVRKMVTKSIKFREEKVRQRLKGVAHLTKWFNPLLTIDEKAAVDLIEERYEEDIKSGMDNYEARDRQSIRVARVKNFAKGNYSLKLDDFSGRLHTPLTQLSSKLRSTISYNSQRLCSIDISNSQFYMSNIFFDSAFWLANTSSTLLQLSTIDQDLSLHYRGQEGGQEELFIMCYKTLLRIDRQAHDVTLFQDLTSQGRFYEHMQNLFLQECSQDFIQKYQLHALVQVKRIMMRIAFDDSSEAQINKSPDHECHRVFREHFPSMASILQVLKTRSHVDVARLLQKIERYIIIDLATKDMVYNHKLAVFTIHDCVVCPLSDLSLVQQILTQHLTKAMGLNPSLKVEYW